jgi:hypothetical protein
MVLGAALVALLLLPSLAVAKRAATAAEKLSMHRAIAASGSTGIPRRCLRAWVSTPHTRFGRVDLVNGCHGLQGGTDVLRRPHRTGTGWKVLYSNDQNPPCNRNLPRAVIVDLYGSCGNPMSALRGANARSHRHTFIDLGGHFGRPRRIIASGDGAVFFNALHWSAWGGTVAKGRGLYQQDDCVPNCAQGTYHHSPAIVHLGGDGVCKGRHVYTWLTAWHTRNHKQFFHVSFADLGYFTNC